MRNIFFRDWTHHYGDRAITTDSTLMTILDISYKMDRYLQRSYRETRITRKVRWISQTLSLFHPLRVNLQTLVVKRNATSKQQTEFNRMMSAIASTIFEFQTNMTKLKVSGAEGRYFADFTSNAEPILQLLSSVLETTMVLMDNNGQIPALIQAISKDASIAPAPIQKMLGEMRKLEADASNVELQAKLQKIQYEAQIKQAQLGMPTSQQRQSFEPGTEEASGLIELPAGVGPVAEDTQTQEQPKEEKKYKNINHYYQILLMNKIDDETRAKSVSAIKQIFGRSMGRTSEILAKLWEMKRAKRKEFNNLTLYWAI